MEFSDDVPLEVSQRYAADDSGAEKEIPRFHDEEVDELDDVLDLGISSCGNPVYILENSEWQ